MIWHLERLFVKNFPTKYLASHSKSPHPYVESPLLFPEIQLSILLLLLSDFG